LVYFCNFQITAQSKQSPNERKFAQSGHPVGSQWLGTDERKEKVEKEWKEKKEKSGLLTISFEAEVFACFDGVTKREGK
jgi:hypothetical protein